MDNSSENKIKIPKIDKIEESKLPSISLEGVKAQLSAVSSLDGPGNILLVGKSFAGKTTLINNLMKNPAKKYHNIIIISDTEKIKPEYGRFSDPDLVFPRLTAEIISFIKRFQKKNKKAKCLLLIDDFITTAKSTSSPEMKVLADFIKLSRHSRCDVIASVQNLKDLSPKIRNNMHFLLFSKNYGNAIDDIAEHYYTQQLDKKELRKELMDIAKRPNNPWLYHNSITGNWFILDSGVHVIKPIVRRGKNKEPESESEESDSE